MAQSHDVTLKLLSTGRVIDVWDRYTITLDMFGPGAPWTFSFWHSTTRSSTWDVLMREVRFGARIEVAIDEAPQLVGTVGKLRVLTSRKGSGMILSGNDLAGDLVAWDADPTIQLRNSALDDIITELVRPFGITVEVGTDATAARETQSNVRSGPRGTTRRRRRQLIDRAHPQPGEKVWSLINSFCRKLGLLAWIAPLANGSVGIVIDAPLTAGAPDYDFRWRLNNGVATADSNILESEWSIDYASTPTSVTVSGNAPRGDTATARSRIAFLNDATSLHRLAATNPPPVPHPRYLQSDTARGFGETQQEARRIIAEANRDFESYVVKVQGHSQRSRRQGNADILYALNSVAHVRNDRDLVDRDMLIHRIEFSGSRDEGQVTTVTQSPLGSIVLVPDQAA